MQVYLLRSDNFISELVTKRALETIRNQMSTGDFNSHEVTEVTASAGDSVWDICPVSGTLFKNRLNT